MLHSPNFDIPNFIIELIDKCVNNLQLGEPDDLRAERLLYAHPLLCMYLKFLFCLSF